MFRKIVSLSSQNTNFSFPLCKFQFKFYFLTRQTQHKRLRSVCNIREEEQVQDMADFTKYLIILHKMLILFNILILSVFWFRENLLLMIFIVSTLDSFYNLTRPFNSWMEFYYIFLILIKFS